MIKATLVILFLLGLVYLILPGPKSISDIQALPDSKKSTEPGDTTQVPNVAAYFSNYRRGFVTKFYRTDFSYLNIFAFVIPAQRFNHPPEESYTYIRDQQVGTYLEEYSYPFRDSLFVNGFEPFDTKGKAYRRGATSILIDGIYYDSKTTIRLFTSPVYARVLVYILTWVCMIFLVKLFKRAWRYKE